MVTLLYPGKEFRITHQEMIKGMKKGTTGVNYRWVEDNEPPFLPPPIHKGSAWKAVFRTAQHGYFDIVIILFRNAKNTLWKFGQKLRQAGLSLSFETSVTLLPIPVTNLLLCRGIVSTTRNFTRIASRGNSSYSTVADVINVTSLSCSIVSSSSSLLRTIQVDTI